MSNNILQGSKEWLAAKQKTIGGSEIFSLVHHYCANELQQMGFKLSKERPFRTVQEMFLKVAFNAKLSPIDSMHSEFGNGMEKYIVSRLDDEVDKIDPVRSEDFILNEDMHKLAACSPDGYIEILSGGLPDFDQTCLINSGWGKGMLELKTANYFANFDEGGCRLQYIMQLQYNMMVANLKWGCLAVLLPKEKEFDDPFFKGRILERTIKGDINQIAQYYDLKYYIYPTLSVFQAMIKKSLNAFQNDIDSYLAGDEKAFPRASEDLTGLQREKALWSQLWPEHYGKKELTEEDELNQLLNDRSQAQVESMFAKQNFDKVTNEIYQKVKSLGLDKFCEIVGTNSRMTWIKNGQTRFYQLKK